MSEHYTPAPLDLDDAPLPECIGPAIETLGRHLHNVWAQERLNDGWSFGPERNDKLKQHPSLIPYDELPERERDYDRIMAIQTLKYIIKSGYQLIPPDQLLDKPNQPELDAIEAQLSSGSAIPSWELRSIWNKRVEYIWAFRPRIYETLGKMLLKRGFALWAIEVCVEGLKAAPESVGLRQQYALGLMRTGRPQQARKILNTLIKESQTYQTGETLGLLASSYKISWSNAHDEAERKESLQHCYNIYQQAFEQTGEYYPGINAATMAVTSGDFDTGKEIASRVQQICLDALEKGDSSYWNLATLGEATLILGKPEEANRYYAQAVELAQDNIDSISSTRRQAVMLTEQLELDGAAILETLVVPPVAVFAGMPCWKNDQIYLPTIEEETHLREQLRAEIRRSGCKIGYATGLGVGDLLFLETLIEENGTARLILPAQADDLINFAHKFVDNGKIWAERLSRILAQASSVTVVSRDLGADPEAFRYCNQIMIGAARLSSQSMGTTIELIELTSAEQSVTDSFDHDGIFSHITRLPSEKLDWGNPIPTASTDLKAEVKGILFADLKAYSKMPDSEVPLYISKFLTEVGKLCDSEPGIQFRNSWGDAFYLVFETIPSAARFAKRLRAFVSDTDWLECGFSHNFKIRISLHAGPLFTFEDPFFNTQTYSGQHTIRGARIEPITDEGQIFVSEPFACLASEQNASDLEFQYLGRRALSKKYGDEALFLLL